MNNQSDQVEFKWLDARLQGNDTVVFRLEDGTLHYNVNSNLNITVIPSDKKFILPKASLQVPTPPKPAPLGQVT
jgi:hypothetical protein